MAVTVVVPYQRDGELKHVERALATLPDDTLYVLAEHDEGGYVQAINEGVEVATTELVVLSDWRAWWDDQALDFLESLAWDADVVYGGAIYRDDENTMVSYRECHQFCPNRLQLEDYLPELAMVRKQAFLDAGGYQAGAWELWRRMHAMGARFKGCPEALYSRTGRYEDPSPKPDPITLEATFYYAATPGTAYWRCLLPARHLPGQAVFNVPFVSQDEHGVVSTPYHQGAAILQFPASMPHDVLRQHFQDHGHKVLVEVDDDYTRPMPNMQKVGWKKTILEARDKSGHSIEGHRIIVGKADGVIVTTETLAKRYRPLNPNVYVCPNQIDPQDWPELKKPDDGVFRVGWFSSGSHAADSPIISRALDWASRQPDVEIVLIGGGFTGRHSWFKGFPFKHYSWSNDLGVYRQFLRELDVALAPVRSEPWGLCRSDLKALENSMVGAVTIASDLPPYQTLNGLPGLIKAKDERGFLGAVQHCVRNSDETRELGRQAREYVLKYRTVERNIDSWKEACHA